MKNIVLVLLVFNSVLLNNISAQEKQNIDSTARNNIYLEYFGNGFYYSLNYERYFSRNISVRAGIMIYPSNGTSKEGHTSDFTLLFFPIMANYIFNFGKHNIEIGIGPDIIYLSGTSEKVGDFSGSAIASTARIGYLYFPTDGGFNIRFAYTPILSEVFTHSVGLGIGYSW